MASDALPNWTGDAQPTLDWPALEERASAATGRVWTSPVEHFELSDAELDARVELETALVLDDAMVARAERELATLGLAPRGIDLRATLREVESGSVLGIYSAVGDRLYVAPENVLPGERTTVEGLAVHELTHALQARHSRIDEATLGLLEHDDLAIALGAVMEGDALFAEAVDAERQGRGAVPTSREQVWLEWNVDAYRSSYPDVPDILIDVWVMPYPLGLEFVRRYVQEGWYTVALDAVLRDPPMSTEQLLQPEKWLDPESRDLPTFVELPRLDSEACSEYGRNSFGVIGLRRFLQLGRDGESPVEREVAVQGWGGDQYAMFDCEGSEHVAIGYVGDSAADADEFADALKVSLRAISEGSELVATELHVRVEGARVQATLGFNARLREQLWSGTEFSRFENLDAFLDAHPEVLERAAALRDSALLSGQHDNAGR